MFNNRLHAYIILWFIIATGVRRTLADDKQKGDTCTTPNGSKGKCVPSENCQILSNKVKYSGCGNNLICCENPGPADGNYLKTNVLTDYATCGIVKEQTRILGGEIAEIGEFPWIAAIEFKDKRDNSAAGVKCGGSLINDEFVLTGAVCVLNREFQPTAVRLGEWKLTTNPDCEEFVANKLCADPVEIITIKETIAHPFFSIRTAHNDIALIRLEHKIQFTEYIRPICVPPLDWPDLKVGSRSIVAGWGITESGTQSDILLKVDVPIESRDACDRLNIGSRSLPPRLRYLCVEGEKGKGACRGDSGGPLMRIYEDNETQSINWFQDGIVSYGIGCGRAGYPAIYTKVSAYSDWISNVIIEYGTR